MKKTVTQIFFSAIMVGAILFTGCSEDDDLPDLEIPDSYTSNSYEANVTAEATVIDELTAMTSLLNQAEANAQSTPVSPISYPSNLAAVTLGSYEVLVSDWLIELVNAANDDDVFQNPGSGSPVVGENGGLLGSRLLDENGLELEQMVEKGSFGAALYNHALTVISEDLSSSDAVDKLVAIHGTGPTFDPLTTTAAATYSRRRSNQTTETGFFYEIRDHLITAKAAIEGGNAFNDIRDASLSEFLVAWEKSNFATVIYYCNATKTLLQSPNGDEAILGDAMHAYAEGVGFAHGFRGLSNKIITDAQIDRILELLLAPVNGPVESYRFINDATLLNNLDQIVDDLQAIYGFTDEEVASFFVNDPT